MAKKMCEICGESPAVIHLQEIENKKVVHIDVCRRCAEKRGYEPDEALSGGMQDLAEKLVTMAKDVSGRREAEGIRCSSCGLFYSEFAKTGRLGCPDCYEAFAAQLKPVLRKAHGSVRHRGRIPGQDQDLREERRQLRQLRAELERAIRHEDYEAAAVLRDRIGALEKAAGERSPEPR